MHCFAVRPPGGDGPWVRGWSGGEWGWCARWQRYTRSAIGSCPVQGIPKGNSLSIEIDDNRDLFLITEKLVLPRDPACLGLSVMQASLFRNTLEQWWNCLVFIVSLFSVTTVMECQWADAQFYKRLSVFSFTSADCFYAHI